MSKKEHMIEHLRKTIITKIIELQDENSCWNVLSCNDPYYPELNYYVPNYKSTLWTLIFLADIGTNTHEYDFSKPLKTIFEHFFDEKNGMFHIGKSHFPIPCLNGNMIYLLSYFKWEDETVINRVVDFFAQYQRFDDGDFKTPSTYPYYSNKSCYGQHTCYWGVVKLLKGLSFIPLDQRSKNANDLISQCIDYILLHGVCFSSRNPSKLILKNIDQLTFPNMYHSDFLEILWLLKREQVNTPKIDQAIALLKSKISDEGTWSIERVNRDLIIPFGKRTGGNEFVNLRAKEVMAYYQ